MARDPREKVLQQERRLHVRSLAVQRYGSCTAEAAHAAHIGSRTILAMAVVGGVSVLLVGFSSLAAWVFTATALSVAAAYVLVHYRRQVTSADQELRQALSSADEDERPAEAHG